MTRTRAPALAAHLSGCDTCTLDEHGEPERLCEVALDLDDGERRGTVAVPTSQPGGNPHPDEAERHPHGPDGRCLPLSAHSQPARVDGAGWWVICDDGQPFVAYPDKAEAEKHAAGYYSADPPETRKITVRPLAAPDGAIVAYLRHCRVCSVGKPDEGCGTFWGRLSPRLACPVGQRLAAAVPALDSTGDARGLVEAVRAIDECEHRDATPDENGYATCNLCGAQLTCPGEWMHAPLVERALESLAAVPALDAPDDKGVTNA